MKKCICLALCLLMLVALFAGCKSKPASATPPDGEAGEPTEPLSFSLDALPEIGAFAPTEKKEYFFPDGPHDTFEARDDYGEVVPYCAKSEKYFATSWSFTDEETGEVYSGTTEKGEEGYYTTYGFATADGKIITEGIYASVYLRQNFRGDSFYTAYREQTYDMYGKADLIATDGSWCLFFDTDVDLDLMNYQKWSDPAMFISNSAKETTLYNYQGEKVLDLTPFRDADMNQVSVCYVDSEKLLVEHNDWEKDKRTFALYDYSGNKLGQLPSSVKWVNKVFQNGVMDVDLADEQKQLMDLHGNALSKPYDDLKYSPSDKCFLAQADYDEGPVVLLDETGKKKKTLDLSYFNLETDDYKAWFFDWDTYTFYDLNGNPTAMDTDGQEIVRVHDDLYDWSGEMSMTYYYAETANGDLYVFDTDGNKITTLQDVVFETFDDSEDDEKYYQIQMENGILSCLKKETMELLELSSGKTQTIPIKSMERYNRTTALSKRLFAVMYNADDGSYHNVCDVFDIETGELLFADAVFTDHFGQYVLVATKSESVLFDETATPLIRLRDDALV